MLPKLMKRKTVHNTSRRQSLGYTNLITGVRQLPSDDWSQVDEGYRLDIVPLNSS